jgi:hypothetical protein
MFTNDQQLPYPTLLLYHHFSRRFMRLYEATPIRLRLYRSAFIVCFRNQNYKLYILSFRMSAEQFPGGVKLYVKLQSLNQSSKLQPWTEVNENF